MEERTIWAEVLQLLFGERWKSEAASALKVRKDFVGQVARGVREAREGHWTELLAILRNRAFGLRSRADQLDSAADRVDRFIATERINAERE